MSNSLFFWSFFMLIFSVFCWFSPFYWFSLLCWFSPFYWFFFSFGMDYVFVVSFDFCRMDVEFLLCRKRCILRYPPMIILALALTSLIFHPPWFSLFHDSQITMGNRDPNPDDSFSLFYWFSLSSIDFLFFVDFH